MNGQVAGRRSRVPGKAGLCDGLTALAAGHVALGVCPDHSYGPARLALASLACATPVA